MNQAIYLKLIGYAILIGVVAIFFLVLSFRGLIYKKPYLISTKWSFAVVVSCFLPQALNSLFLTNRVSAGLGLNGIAFFVILCVVMYWSMVNRKAYAAYGITSDAFREALHSVLKNKGLAFEETLSSLKLPEKSAELQISIQGWIGTGMIRIKDKKDNQLLDDVVRGLNDYYQKHETPVNYVIFVFYLIFGLFLMSLPFLFLNFFQHLHESRIGA